MLPLALAALPLLQSPTDSDVGKTVVLAPRSDAPATSTSTGRTVVTGEELARTGAPNLPLAIGRAAGVWIQQTNLGGGSPFIRGLTGNQVLLLIDGVRVNDSTTRFGPNQSLNTIDPWIVDRVEIIRGPSSVLYGSDAIGGVILVWTKTRAPGIQGGANGLGADVGVLGSTNPSGGRAMLGLDYGTDRTGTLGIGSIQDWGDVTSGDGTEWPTGYHGNAVFGSEEIAIDEQRTLRLTARVDRTYDVPRTDRLVTGFGQTQPANQRYDFSLQDRRALGLTYTDRADNGLWEELQARFSYNTYDETRDRIATGSTTQRLESDEVETLALELDWRRAFGDSHLLTWGFDLYYDEVESRRTDVDIPTGTGTPGEGQFAPDAQYGWLGLFVQDEIVAFDVVDVTAGLRYSYYDYSFDEFPSQGTGSEEGDFDGLVGSLQAAGDLAEGVRLTGTLAQGFRAPNLDDLAKNGSFAGGTELANPDLDPEKSLTAEIALDLVRPSWSVGLALWRTDIDDVIGRVLEDPGGAQTGDETYRRENVGEAELHGIELVWGQRLGAEASPWRVDAVLGYVHGQQFDDTVDPNTGTKPLNDVPYRRIPPLAGQVGLNWESPSRFLDAIGWARLETLFAAQQDRLHPGDVADPRIDPNGTDGWWIVNLDVGGPFGDPARGSTWNLGIHNLFDYDYRVHGSGFDAPGIALVGGLRLSF